MKNPIIFCLCWILYGAAVFFDCHLKNPANALLGLIVLNALTMLVALLALFKKGNK